MNKLLHNALERGITKGALRVTYADGRSRSYGTAQDKEVAVRFADAAAERELAVDPGLRLGELYMDGRLIVEHGNCYDLVSTVKRNVRGFSTIPGRALHAARFAASFAAQRQTLATAKRNIAHHYDLDERFYRLFLDDDMQYTCAYFPRPKITLAQAQLLKKRHIAAKLRLKPGQRVLDIGSGWGGMCLYLAEVAQVHATGVTLSRPQCEVSTRRAEERGLTERVKFVLSDYRNIVGPFDRLVSVGMFEAIGLKEFDNFFQTAARLMKRKGVLVLHSIGRTKPRAVPNPWMEKYIFPGSYIPSLSEVLPAAERAGFIVNDVEILRLHYAKTLAAWRRRFCAKKEEVLALYDERFFRMWEFYLCSAEAGFRIDRLFVFQMQLTRYQEAVPLTREYIAEAEAELEVKEQTTPAYCARVAETG